MNKNLMKWIIYTNIRSAAEQCDLHKNSLWGFKFPLQVVMITDKVVRRINYISFSDHVNIFRDNKIKSLVGYLYYMKI
jgi:hypothetical protein